MLGAITPDQFEQMKQQLIVPLAVSDILSHDLNIEPDMQYGLHMALSEVDPDSALLAIALCAQDLAIKSLNKAPIAGALQNQATEILAEYGPSWLRNNLNAPIPSHVYEDVLETVPEDLESLADLMDALSADLDEINSASTILAQLLSIQARAHMEIAEFVLAEIAYEKEIFAQKTGAVQIDRMEQNMAENAALDFEGDNIILFPGTQN